MTRLLTIIDHHGWDKIFNDKLKVETIATDEWIIGLKKGLVGFQSGNYGYLYGLNQSDGNVYRFMPSGLNSKIPIENFTIFNDRHNYSRSCHLIKIQDIENIQLLKEVNKFIRQKDKYGLLGINKSFNNLSSFNSIKC